MGFVYLFSYRQNIKIVVALKISSSTNSWHFFFPQKKTQNKSGIN